MYPPRKHASASTGLRGCDEWEYFSSSNVIVLVFRVLR
jgi:hypothetical protein